MVEHMNLLSMVLPRAFQFLNGGWWTLHAVAILVVAYLGYKLGRLKQS